MVKLTKETRGFERTLKDFGELRDVFEAFSVISKEESWTITPMAYNADLIQTEKPDDRTLICHVARPYIYYKIVLVGTD